MNELNHTLISKRSFVSKGIDLLFFNEWRCNNLVKRKSNLEKYELKNDYKKKQRKLFPFCTLNSFIIN